MPIWVIHYEVDSKLQQLMTSLLDAECWPAGEILAMYHECWEIEIAFDELKTRMLERKESLCSKTPVGVHQEIRGLLAYNLIRHRMGARGVQAGGGATRDELRLLAAPHPGLLDRDGMGRLPGEYSSASRDTRLKA